MKKRWIRWTALLLSVLTAAVIFLFSAQNGEKSGDSSDGLTEKILYIFGVEKEDEADEHYQEVVISAGRVLRKMAHFAEYFIFGIVVSGFFSTFGWKWYGTGGVSLAVCALYAASDELHQYFVPGRCASVWDVLLDSTGALCGIALVLGICVLIRRKSSAKVIGN